METCDECGKRNIIRKRVDFVLLGTNLGKFDAFVCSNCNDTVFEGKTMGEIEKRAKAAGLFGIAAKTRIGTAGNALDVKLPKLFAQFFGLKKGQEVILEPIDKTKFQVVIEQLA